jgi:hypothetical protein
VAELPVSALTSSAARCGRAGAVLAALLVMAPRLARPGPPRVDWERRSVLCTGLGAPTLRESSGNVATARVRTERLAREAALRACLVAVGSVLVRTGEYAAALLERDAKLKGAVEEMVRRVNLESTPRFFADGGTAVDLEVPLDGALTSALLDADSAGGPAVSAAEARTAPREASAGVLVDATRCAVSPSLAPRLLGPDGRAAYQIGMVTPGARANGGAAYVAGEHPPTGSWRSRVGDAPKVVRAVRALGADLVLSAEDAESLKNDPALSEGRVAILVTGKGP